MEFGEIFPPISKINSIRFILSIDVTFHFEVESINEKKTTLHGDIEEGIYMKQLEGFAMNGKNELVCRLKRSLYWLNKSPRTWYQKFYTYILRLAFTRRKYDNSSVFQISS